MLIFTVLFQSCSDELSVNDAKISSLENSVLSTKRPPNIKIVPEVTLISYSGNCFKYELRIMLYDNETGESSEIHAAIIQSGFGCSTEGLVAGPGCYKYKDDYVIKDSLLNKESVGMYFDKNPEVYINYVKVRNNLKKSF